MDDERLLIHGPIDEACVVERVTIDTVPEDGWVYVTGEGKMHAENHQTTRASAPAHLVTAIGMCVMYCFPNGTVYWATSEAHYRLVYRIRFDAGPVVAHEPLTDVDEATVEVGTLLYVSWSGALAKLCEGRKIAILMFPNEEDAEVSVIWALSRYSLDQCLQKCTALRVPTRDDYVLK